MSLMSDALRAFTRPLPPFSSSSHAAFSERSGENNSMLTSETRATRAVRILCLNYFAQKRCSREGEKENRDGEKEGARTLLTSYLPTSDSTGRLSAAKVLPAKERIALYFSTG